MELEVAAMNRSFCLALGALSTFALLACEAEETTAGGGGGGTGDGAGAEGGNAAQGSGGGTNLAWQPLMTAEWQLGPGEEITSDLHTFVLDRDMYIGGIRPIAPKGTHHTVLANGPAIMGNIIYASGVGTNPLEFPPGVGLKLHAGDELTLQLHLFNTALESLSGTSGIEVVEIAPEDIQEEADIFLPGPIDLNIAPNQVTTQSGVCTVDSEQTIFAVFPHMHQLGTHFKTTLTIGGADTVIHDGAYDFNHQAFIRFEPIQLKPGDSITTECTWNNTTQQTVGWGESSTTEMCFSILYRYPAKADQGFCIQ